MIIDHLGEAWEQGAHGCIGSNLGGIPQQFLAPNQSCLVAETDHVLEEAAEHVHTQPLTYTSEAGMIGQRLIKVVAQYQR